MSSKHTSHEILEDPDFKALARQKGIISFILTILTLVVYYGFISLIAFNKDVLAQKIGNVTLGIPLGVGVIVLSIVFTGIYVTWANSKYDAMVERVKRKIGEE